MLKHLEIADPNSCLNSAEDGEPVFTLRAHDPIAARVVDFWVMLSQGMGIHIGRLDEARALVKSMEQWRKAHADD